MRLSLEEGRVIGCLIEKQLTTPQQYPLTLNALVSACNQSSNREPVVRYDDRTVVQALRRLKDDGLVRFVHPSHGRSVIRYGQSIDERLGRDERTLSLVAVLLLRGPQTAGELRARCERMATFDGIVAVEADLGRMSSGPEPVVRRLPRRPGQKEERWVQLLTADGIGTVDDAGSESRADRVPEPVAWSGARAGPGTAPGDGRPDGPFEHAANAWDEEPSGPVNSPPSGPVDSPPSGPGDLLPSGPVDSPPSGPGDLLSNLRDQLAALAGDVAELRAEMAAFRAEFE